MRVSEEEEREQEIETLFEETMIENFPKQGKEIDIQVQEVQRFLNKMNPKKSKSRPTVIKKLKVKNKERILKAAEKSS